MMEAVKEVHLTVNGTEYVIINPGSDVYLTEWLRDKIHLKGVKKLCGEGGCGSCIVAISKGDPIANPGSIFAVNSCLQPVIALDGYHVVTVEGLGNKKDGFHILQEKFAEHFASQCGFCTPGFVMNGFSYLLNNDNSRSKKEIEKSLDGNICRCTGYRPILDAMKTFTDESGTVDIEDLRKIKICTKNCIQPKPKIIDHTLETSSGKLWYNPGCLTELFAILKRLDGKSFDIIAGNTGTGVFKSEPTSLSIGINSVTELNEIKTYENELQIGAGVTLTCLVQFLQKNFPKSVFSEVVDHLEKVASRPIRNVGTWAGNLMLLNKHKNFPSDIFIIFTAVGARLQIADANGTMSIYSMEEFFSMDFSLKIIISVALPILKGDEILKTYTVVPRKQNSYGYVNAGFHAAIDKENLSFKEKPRIVFGGVGLEMMRATQLENFLEGKNMMESEIFMDAVKLLQDTLRPNPENKTVNYNYCRNVAVNLFYKFWISVLGDKASKRALSAINSFTPNVSSGFQSFHVSKEENSSVNKPHLKIEGKTQASGETQFVGDIPQFQNEVYATFVLSTVASANLERIDSSDAENHPGFVAFITSKDIPGVNSWQKDSRLKEIFPTKEVSFNGQPLAVVVAEERLVPEDEGSMYSTTSGNGCLYGEVAKDEQVPDGMQVESPKEAASAESVEQDAAAPVADESVAERKDETSKSEELATSDPVENGEAEVNSAAVNEPEAVGNDELAADLKEDEIEEDEVDAEPSEDDDSEAEDYDAEDDDDDCDLDDMNSQKNAEAIAKLVKVEYSNVRKPVMTLEEAMEKELFHPSRFPIMKTGDAENAFTKCDHVIEGEVKSGSQHHFYMEPQTCLVVPQDIGCKIYSTTQCSKFVQEYVSKALGVKTSSIDVHVPRIGGGFGGKIEYPSQIACAVAVAADTLNRPARMTMALSDNLKVVGKRASVIAKYKVGFSKEGRLEACDVVIYNDSGICGDNIDGFLAARCVENAYFCPNWNVRIVDCKTNTPSNTFVRAPGYVQGIFFGETILEHVASFLGKEKPEDIKELNLYRNGQKTKRGMEIANCLLDKIWNDLKEKSDYNQRCREIAQFNKEQRWKKRGISMVPLMYNKAYLTFNFTTMVTIYYADGTVAVSSGGIEMGQGMNTRVCQVVSNQLEIPLDLITVKHHSTLTSPNSFATGASVSSEINCLSVHKCCEVLKERMKPVKEKFPGASWEDLIKECSKQKIDLSCQYMFYAPEKASYAYTSYGAACSEVEVDVLTGEHCIIRSDIIFDCGESINPRIDIGQIEGAFVMGLGLWFTEKIDYDEETGEQLTTNTWTYKPPMSKDIPMDFRVHLMHEAVNPIGYIRSKAVGEPGICMASSCLFAVKRAIEAARAEFEHPAEYFQLDGPATVDKIQSLCQVEEKYLKL